MVHCKRITTKFLQFLLLLVLVCMEYDFQLVSGEIRCLDKERDALLMFKKGLVDYDNVLSSWGSADNQKECCRWWGVRCSNKTGHVTGLQLRSYWSPGDPANLGFGGNISSSLLELQHLSDLDLSSNDFGGDQIPNFIGSMKQLQHLNLSHSSFSGTIPRQLGNLTNLRTLDLSHNYDLRSYNLDCLSHLSFLTRLDLSFSTINDSNCLHHLLKIPSLKELSLRRCGLNSSTSTAGLFINASFTSLLVLDLAFNDLRFYNLDWFSHLSFLTGLDLSESIISDLNWLHQLHKLHSLKELSLRGCEITDATSTAGLFTNSSFTSLLVLDLSFGELTSSIFDWLFNISRSLVKLDLRYNQLNGSIPDAFENFIFLEYLDLSQNAFVGKIPKSLRNLSHLQTLDLSANALGGSLEESFGNLVSLETLWLSHNQLTGSVHHSLGQLSKLEVLDISFNFLEGTISEAHFVQLHSLKDLDLSFNLLTLDFSPDWVPPFQLEFIFLTKCKIPSFPKWLLTQRNLRHLDMSSANITDEVPKLFWNLCHSIANLNLSNNQINGTIPAISSDFRGMIDVSSNKFSGPVPLLHPNISFFQLSQNMFSGPLSPSICPNSNKVLYFLDLSGNQLGGGIPKSWENMTGLAVLNLNNNNFSGEIPPAFGSLSYLGSLHLGGNNLSGELPSALKNCRKLTLLDIGGNNLTGNIPSWLGGNFPYMTWLSLRNNRFYGNIPPEICHLTLIQLLDFSKNNISGKIPVCFNNFTALVDKNKSLSITHAITNSSGIGSANIEYALVQWKGQESKYKSINLELLRLIDLSSNGLVGNIPIAFSNLSTLVSLNLSRNYLTGCIDQNIGQMDILEVLDLSRNQLSGEIPIGLAQLHFLAILDLSNNNLSGKIPLSTQLQSFDPSAYAGNSKLCGLPLPLCPGDHPVSPISNQGEDENTHDDKDVWFLRTSFSKGPWISIILGFIVGFWGIVGSLVLKKSWRTAYYSFWDDIGDWLYVTTTIFLKKLEKKIDHLRSRL